MRVVCIIQSRLGSTRFPRKALADIEGKPMIRHVVERAMQIQGVDKVVVAVPYGDYHAPITDRDYHRGPSEYEQAIGELLHLPDGKHVGLISHSWYSDDDVLRRYKWAALDEKADAVVRITGDCPLLDPEESSAVVAELKIGRGYVTNRRADTDGLDTEAFWIGGLLLADERATEASDREHVTPYMQRQGTYEYRGRSIPNGEKWSVDTLADLELVRRRYREQMVSA